MAEKKIAIIGRGLAGLSLTLRMAKAGYRLEVFGLDKGPTNASRCAQGVVCNKGLIFAESPLFRSKLLAQKKLENWLSQLENDSGMAIPRFWSGVDEPYWSEDDFRSTVHRVYRGNFWGCYRPENRRVESWPLGSKTPMGYLHYPDDAWFDVDIAMTALEKACMNQGVIFFDQTVNDLKAFLSTYEHTVVAAGASSMSLLQAAGIEVPKFFLIGGQSLVWNQNWCPDARILVKGTLSLAILPERIILGSSSWKSGSEAVLDIDSDRKQLLAQASTAFGLPLPDVAKVTSRYGTRLRFSDRMPVLGIWPGQGNKLSILTGFYKNGLQLADLCAEQLFLELEGGEISELGRSFHVSRFFRDGRRAPGSPPRHCALSHSENESGTE